MAAISIDDIIPRPLRVTPGTGLYRLDADTTLMYDDQASGPALLLNEYLGVSLDVTLARGNIDGSLNRKIEIRVGEVPAAGDEAYRLEISVDTLTLRARHVRGLICGVQSIRQLLPSSVTARGRGVAELPCGTIDDAPRFCWRGMMLDCARHFMPVEFIYKWIDLLSLHKLNVFHWHLTDDQGWRIEISRYPLLTAVGAWRKNTLVGHALPFRDADAYAYNAIPHGGFYTQEEIREVVAYAEARNVTIVPEIELPGHSQAAIAAYAHLGNVDAPLEVWNHWGVSDNILNVEPSTISFYKNVLLEVMALFPSQFIHVGGDEAPKGQWVSDARVQKRMVELGIKDEHELQSWFIREMSAFLADHGRRLIGWDEILEGGLAAGATVMSWRGEAGGISAARAGHDVVMAPHQHVYLDQYQTEETEGEPLAIGGHNPLRKVYAYEPIPRGLSPKETDRVLGAQAQLWTEYMPTSRDVERMAFPRACALAEVLWSSKVGIAGYEDFEQRLQSHASLLRQLDVKYHRGFETLKRERSEPLYYP